jgi:hypothetical protein
VSKGKSWASSNFLSTLYPERLPSHIRALPADRFAPASVPAHHGLASEARSTDEFPLPMFGHSIFFVQNEDLMNGDFFGIVQTQDSLSSGDGQAFRGEPVRHSTESHPDS